MLDNPETFTDSAASEPDSAHKKRAYSGQRFSEQFDRSESIADFLEHGRIWLFRSGDLFQAKRHALTLLVFGLGRPGKQHFDDSDFVINHAELPNRVN